MLLDKCVCNIYDDVIHCEMLPPNFKDRQYFWLYSSLVPKRSEYKTITDSAHSGSLLDDEATLSSSSLSLFIIQRYLALDDRVAWAYFEFPEDLFNGETVEEWVALNGKLGEGQEGNVNIILSFTVSTGRVFVIKFGTCHIASAYPCC